VARLSKSKIQNPKSKIQNPKSKIQNPKWYNALPFALAYLFPVGEAFSKRVGVAEASGRLG
jgi:hypothetical protein